MADVGTIVELSEKIVSTTINDARNLALEKLSIGTPWVDHTMSGNSDNFKLLIPISPEPALTQFEKGAHSFAKYL
jgi:hypothetical protein